MPSLKFEKLSERLGIMYLSDIEIPLIKRELIFLVGWTRPWPGQVPYREFTFGLPFELSRSFLYNPLWVSSRGAGILVKEDEVCFELPLGLRKINELIPKLDPLLQKILVDNSFVDDLAYLSEEETVMFFRWISNQRDESWK